MVCNSFSHTIAGTADSSDRTQIILENAQKYFKDKAPNTDTTNTSGLRGKDDVAGYSWAKYVPSVLPVFWSLRLMMGVGIFMVALTILGPCQARGDRASTPCGLKSLTLITLPIPSFGVSFGWAVTGIGRRPFTAYPSQDAFNAGTIVQNAGAGVYMLIDDGLSSVVSSVEFLISLVVFTLLYLVLGIVWSKLLVRYSKEGINTPASNGSPVGASREFSFTY